MPQRIVDNYEFIELLNNLLKDVYSETNKLCGISSLQEIIDTGVVEYTNVNNLSCLIEWVYFLFEPA